MNGKLSMIKRIVLTVALVAGVTGLARADDSSMNMWTGDSYRYFNGGKHFPYGRPVLDYAPSTYRATPPQDPMAFERQHFPFASPVDSNAASKCAATYPEDALAYKRKHFPFVNQPSERAAKCDTTTAKSIN